ncbi:WG repeat protein [Anseongella ginsenosidimutans]|uniref:WG repeat protein n=2 Tax=Anseongella ginsenosidimutans TaxID=496056 RepID=A0A4R3KPS9_9SPHI|nr:WG repeat protein [Anseongella ginsenosidimutans]
MERILLILVFLMFSGKLSLAQSPKPDHIQVISDFKDDLAIALDTETHKEGIISKMGDLLVEPIYNDITRFPNGFFKIITFKKKQRVGLADTSGKIIVKPKKFSSIWLAKKPDGADKFQFTKESSEKVYYLAENGKVEVDWSY